MARFDVINLFDRAYEIRNGAGVGASADNSPNSISEALRVILVSEEKRA
jgi:hypothetical protein